MLGFRSRTGIFFVFFSLILPFFTNVWVVSLVPKSFASTIHAKGMIIRCAREFDGSVLTHEVDLIKDASRSSKDR